MIEKRTLPNDVEVGFNTKTNSFCNLDYEEPVEELTSLDKMSIEELKEYAIVNNIELGSSTALEGILKKIKAAQN